MKCKKVKKIEIYVVDKKDYRKYRQPELEKMCYKVNKVTDAHVVIHVKFSKDSKDFARVDMALYQLLIKQYDNYNYIKQTDLELIEQELEKVEKRDVETLGEILWWESANFKNIKEIVETIKNHKNYMLLYIADEKDLGDFIVGNIEQYKIPSNILKEVRDYLDFKGIAEKYLYDSYIKVVKTQDLLLDISKNPSDELIEKLQDLKIDSRTVFDNLEKNKKNNQSNRNKKESEEEFE